MEPQDAYQGFSPSTYGAPADRIVAPLPAVTDAPAPQLRPLSTGEILDRTFALYRRRFWLFTGIAAVPATVATLSSVMRLLYLAFTHQPTSIVGITDPALASKALGNLLLTQVYFLPATLLFLVVYGISHAATVDAVSNITQGASANAQESYGRVRGRWLRWSGISFRQLWSLVWPVTVPIVIVTFSLAFVSRKPFLASLLVIAGFLVGVASAVLGVMNFLRNALATPAGVLENLGVNAALKRSKQLVAGRKGRIFVMLLLMYVLELVAGGIQVPFVLLAARARGAEQVLLLAIQLVVGFVAVTLITPVASIALCLFYVDERIRREGYDIEILMQRSLTPAAINQAEV